MLELFHRKLNSSKEKQNFNGLFPLEEISHVNASAYWVENSSDYHFTAINILYGESCKCRKILVFGKQLGRNPTAFKTF